MNYLPAVMICLSLIILAASAALVSVLARTRRNKPKHARNGTTGHRPKAASWRWQTWFLPLGLALLITLWTISGALFFLVIVWIMHLKPKPDSNYMLDETQKKTAKRIYTWLFWSSILTVPFFSSMIGEFAGGRSSTNERFLAALIPFTLHLFLLLGLTSRSAFVYRHTQQGILLVALRAGMAGLSASIGRYPEDGIWLFLLGNGSLWLFGNMWGRNQVLRGECWWMKRKGEAILPPQTQVHDETVMDNELEELLQSFHTEGNTARQKALDAFRAGTPEIRKKAVLALARLGDVESF